MTLPLQTEFSRTEVGARNWPKAVKSMIRKKLNEGALTHVSSVEIKLCP